VSGRCGLHGLNVIRSCTSCSHGFGTSVCCTDTRYACLEPVALAQVREKTFGSFFDHVEHALEALLATIVGVGNFAFRTIRCVLQKQAEPVFQSWRTNGLQVGKIFPIHGEDVLELLDVGTRCPAALQAAEINAAP